ncbi:MAG: SDR family oxidoreductase [Actinobacteria bacterium]|nr:SDR family oxidoreductase [Actinomycetota bacterium]
MDLGLDGRVALVAGASSGLGLAVATALAAEGAHVAIGARTAERLRAARDEVDAAGRGRVMSTAVDVRDTGAVRDWVAEAAATLGGLHIVVANAGGPPPGLATDFDVEDYRDAVELNMLSSVALTQAALPHLRSAGWGRVLFVTSVAVKEPIPDLALSNTARAGVLGYAKSLVHALGDAGITVNVLAPGRTRTARLEQLAGDDTDEGLARMAADIPLGRVGEPAEFAAAAVFLASGPASYITGAVLPVDGGSYGGLS